MGRLLALLAALIMAALIAWRSQTPPEPAPADAAPVTFSAGRAMADVEVLGATPHPIGSPRNLQVRDHLLGRMRALGLQPRVQRASAFVVHRAQGLQILGGRVENLAGVLPGRDRTAPALALMAHYDSVPGSPGAADDAAGVASALEIVRAIRARGVPARDVALVITDGEESGLLGASAFFRDDPLARHLGFVLNMETRGGGGRAQMFETGSEAGEAVALLSRNARRPQATSLESLVYRLMPNDTDFTLARRAGLPGFNFAFLGRQFDYHSPTATPANLDRGALQDMGDQVLGVAAAMAFAPTLPARGPDLVYGQLFGNLLLAYPPALGWALLALAAALLGLAVARARRLGPLAWSDVARGVGAALFAAAGAAAVLHFARRATGVSFGYMEQRALLAQAPRWETALLLLALGFLILAAAELARGRRSVVLLLPLAAGLGACAFGGLDSVGLALGVAAALLGLAVYGRPAGRPGGWAGVLIVSLAAAVAVQAAAPAAAYILAWPLLLAAVVAAVTALGALSRRPYIVVLALAAGCGLGWIGGQTHLAFLSVDLPELLVLPLWAAAALIWPLAQPAEGAPPARLAARILLAAGFAVLAVVRLDPPWSARYPQPASVVYRIDQDSGQAWRVASLSDARGWTEAVLRADGAAGVPYRHWSQRRLALAAAAPRVAAPAPILTLAPQPGGGRTLHAVPPPGARVLELQLRPAASLSLTAVDGLPVDLVLAPGVWTRLRWEAAPQGVDLAFGPNAAAGLELRYAATLEGWPQGAKPLPPRPPQVMAVDESGSTVLTGTRRWAW